MRFIEHINEAIFDISDHDVELLYKPIKPIVKKALGYISKEDFDSIETLGDEVNNKYSYDSNSDTQVVKMFKPGELKFKSPTLRAAYKLNPVTVIVGFHEGTSFYSGTESLIVVGLPLDALTGANRYPERTVIEVSDTAARTAIRHELSHWLRDTFHENILRKRAVDPKWLKKIEKMGMKLYLTATEIDAVIHGIVGLKKAHLSKWDKLSWKEFIKLDPSLTIIDRELGQEWRKLIKKRMVRENLLGKRMK